MLSVQGANLVLECQINKAHHIFCSQSCYRQYMMNQLSTTHVKVFHKIEKYFVRLCRKFKKIPAHIPILSILIIALILSIVLSISSMYRVKKITTGIECFQTKRRNNGFHKIN